MKNLKVGVIGLASRGKSLLKDVLLYIDGITITAVCDIYEDRVKDVAKIVFDSTGKEPFQTTDYREILDKEKIDCVMNITSWQAHTEISICAMERGIPCASEVGGVEDIRECFDLVETWERTQTPYMFLENCCYGRRELMVKNMVKQGLFGEIVHCSGGYHHDLRPEVAFGKENRHYRLEHYLSRNCENYPTHEIGPIARVLDINHGNRFVSLTSTASKAAGMHQYIIDNKADDEKLVNVTFAQGDIVTTVIQCERGETITITLDTTLPRYYSRGFTVRGTKGLYEEFTDSVFVDSEVPEEEHFKWKEHWGNAEKYEEKYDDEIWKKYLEEGVRGGHGGMDYLVCKDFFDCVRDGKPMPIDVYDAAAWMAITPLSAKSIAEGSVPVKFPDFKNRK